MHYHRIITPTHRSGRIILLCRNLLELMYIFFRHPDRRLRYFSKLIFRLAPKYTMLAPSRLIMLYKLIENVNQNNIEGDVVECGVWKGGSWCPENVCVRQRKKDGAWDSD